jgi:PhnB protein
MHIEPYLDFDGRCDEAIEFYKGAIGAEVKMLVRFKDNPGMCTPGMENKVMHANLHIGDSTMLLSDGRCLAKSKFEGIMLSLSVSNEVEADRLFAALSNGGTVNMPLGKTFFSPRFGMVDDSFGVSWMVIVQ